jgi:hypothetical protein
VEGESGAPLEEGELAVLDRIYENVKPYLTAEGRKTISKYGRYVVDSDGDYVTPLVNGDEECAYTVYDKGIAQCGIERAFLDGKTKFRKPISCHLYPIRVNKLKSGEALNYHRWDICRPACSNGKQLGVRIFEFLKTPLIRKYGEKWYRQLEKLVKQTAG